jgi:hypothetical protein
MVGVVILEANRLMAELEAAAESAPLPVQVDIGAIGKFFPRYVWTLGSNEAGADPELAGRRKPGESWLNQAL